MISRLVVDTAPFLKNATISGLAEEYYTVPEVLDEIRDPVSRELFTRLNIDLKVRNPSAQAMKMVLEFAKKTGDLAVLSRTDLKVLGLAVTLELMDNQGQNLRKEPVTPTTNLHKTLPPTPPDSSDELCDKVAHVSLGNVNDEGWISRDSIAKVATAKTGCMTSDFAMQNVLLQMNIQLVSTDGLEIKRLKSFVLRCHACYKVTKDMSKQFCPNCGNNTLIRTSVGVDADGSVVYYLKRNFQYNNRGQKYSIPTTQSGRHAKNLILAEDQKEYQNALKKTKSKKAMASLLDPDFEFESKFSRPTIGYGRKNPNEAKRRK